MRMGGGAGVGGAGGASGNAADSTKRIHGSFEGMKGDLSRGAKGD